MNVAVLIPTYNRPTVLSRAMYGLLRHISGASLHFFVGNDGDMPVDVSWCSQAQVFNEPTRSLGANLNRLIDHAVHAGFDLLFQMDDDHILEKPLDISPHIEKLMSDETAGWIRLMGVGYHNLHGRLDGHYWRVDWDSPELYITSNRPHLKHARFHQRYGTYRTKVKLGVTEESFCHQCKDKGRVSKTPDVLIPLTYDEGAWDHVGDSWQEKGY